MNGTLLSALSLAELARLERVLVKQQRDGASGSIDLAAVVSAIRQTPPPPPDNSADPRIYELTLEGYTPDEARAIAARERLAKRADEITRPRRRRRRFRTDEDGLD
jgi:hypothetical protein